MMAQHYTKKQMFKDALVLRSAIRKLVKEEGPLFPISANIDYDPATAADVTVQSLSALSDFLGAASEKIIKLAELPTRQRSAEALTLIEEVLSALDKISESSDSQANTQTYGDIDWSKSFLGSYTDGSIGKIYNAIDINTGTLLSERKIKLRPSALENVLERLIFEARRSFLNESDMIIAGPITPDESSLVSKIFAKFKAVNGVIPDTGYYYDENGNKLGPFKQDEEIIYSGKFEKIYDDSDPTKRNLLGVREGDKWRIGATKNRKGDTTQNKAVTAVGSGANDVLIKLSADQIKIEEAIKLGARPIYNEAGRFDYYASLLAKNNIISDDVYTREKIKLLMSAKTQSDIDNSKIINRHRYYFVIIDKNNPKIISINKSIRQKDFIYSNKGLPLFGTDGKPLTTDVLSDEETSGSLLGFLVNTLRIWEVSPASWAGETIKRMPPGTQKVYLRCLRGTLIVSSIGGSFPWVGQPFFAALAAGSFAIEASVNVSNGNYGLAALDIVCAIVPFIQARAMIAAQMGKADLILSLERSAVTGQPLAQVAGQASKTTMTQLRDIIVSLRSSGADIVEESGKYFLRSNATQGAGIEVGKDVFQMWQTYGGNLGLQAYIDFYANSDKLLRTMFFEMGAMSLDILWGDATIEEFEQNLEKIADIKELEAAKASHDQYQAARDKAINYKLTANQLDSAQIAMKAIPAISKAGLDANNVDDPMIFINVDTGEHITGVPRESLIGKDYSKGTDASLGLTYYDKFKPEDVSNIDFIYADDKTYNSISKLVDQFPENIFSSKSIKIIGYVQDPIKAIRITSQTQN